MLKDDLWNRLPAECVNYWGRYSQFETQERLICAECLKERGEMNPWCCLNEARATSGKGNPGNTHLGIPIFPRGACWEMSHNHILVVGILLYECC